MGGAFFCMPENNALARKASAVLQVLRQPLFFSILQKIGLPINVYIFLDVSRASN